MANSGEFLDRPKASIVALRLHSWDASSSCVILMTFIITFSIFINGDGLAPITYEILITAKCERVP